MIDMHCHILPAVDDGSNSLEESIEMARIAWNNGIDTIIATPHYIQDAKPFNRNHNSEVLEVFKKELMINKIGIEILLGNEVYVTPDAVKLLEMGEMATLNDSRYVLMEFPMMDIPLYVESLIYELKLKGFIPVIAHPERNAKIIENPNILHSYISKGALAQTNIPSVLGKYGEDIQETAKILLKHDMVHFLGTDAHTCKARSLKPEKTLKIIEDMIGKERVYEMAIKNPKLVIEDRDIEIREPIKYSPKKGIRKLFEKIFSA